MTTVATRSAFVATQSILKVYSFLGRADLATLSIPEIDVLCLTSRSNFADLSFLLMLGGLKRRGLNGDLDCRLCRL